jgi:hypothetical protein
MKVDSKILIRSLTTYLMLFTGVVIVLWFVFVVVTSVLGLRYYSGESIEVMFFLLFMSLVIGYFRWIFWDLEGGDCRVLSI